MKVELRYDYSWDGACSANDVKLPDWLHPYVTGWSGECVYLSTDQGEHTVEVGDRIELYWDNDDTNDNYISVIKAIPAYE